MTGKAHPEQHLMESHSEEGKTIGGCGMSRKVDAA
jgi:hypothetical protein